MKKNEDILIGSSTTVIRFLTVMSIVIACLCCYAGYQMGVQAEKIGQLEDCVFNHKGCYGGD